jgi:hypothetical protein
MAVGPCAVEHDCCRRRHAPHELKPLAFAMPDQRSPKSKFHGQGSQIRPDLIDDDWPNPNVIIDRPRRKWSLAALALILTAIAAEMIAKRHAGFGMMAMARAAQAMNYAKQFEDEGMDDLAQLAYDESARLKQLAFHNPYHSDRWSRDGLVFFLLAAGCWSISHRRNEGGPQIWLAALFISYFLLLMLMA